MRARVLPTLAAVSLVLIPAACAAGSPGARASLPPVWAAEFDRYLAGSLNDFERGVLEDYRITDAEYAAAREGFRQCAEDAGYEVNLLGEGFSIEAGPALRASLTDAEQNAGAEAVVVECEPGWTDKVGYLYENLRHNADATTGLEDVRACFERHGLPGADLEDDELQRLIAELVEGSSREQVEACLAVPAER